MKYVAWILVILVLAGAAGMIYLYFTSQVVVEALGAQAYEAQSQQAYFDDLKQRLANGAVQGTVFMQDALGESSEYAFFTYTVRLRNGCMLPADMVEVQIVPTQDDVLQLGDTGVKALARRSRGDITATILTKRDSDPMREIIITYYIWGRSFTLQTTYSR